MPKSSFGFIAQEVEQVIPNVIGTAQQGKTLSYIQLIPLLVDAWQTQQETMKGQSDQIDRLTQQLQHIANRTNSDGSNS